MYKVAILLATYNGEKYIREQLDSILNQKNEDSFLLDIFISDDASTDATRDIIINEYPNCYLISSSKKGGAKNNFKYLIDNCPDDYDLYFFSDQDDVWIVNKIHEYLKHLSFEVKSNESALLYCSDLKVVDKNLNVIAESFLSSQNLYRFHNLNSICIENNVVGCTVAINNFLFKLLQNISFDKAIMHDWFIAIVALCVGRVIFIDSKTILYRQHSSNCVGATKNSIFISFKKIFKCKKIVFDIILQNRDISKQLVTKGFPVPDIVNAISKFYLITTESPHV